MGLGPRLPRVHQEGQVAEGESLTPHTLHPRVPHGQTRELFEKDFNTLDRGTRRETDVDEPTHSFIRVEVTIRESHAAQGHVHEITLQQVGEVVRLDAIVRRIRQESCPSRKKEKNKVQEFKNQQWCVYVFP